MPEAGQPIELGSLRSPIQILDLDIDEGNCSLLLQETLSNDPATRRPVKAHRAVWVRFSSLYCCAAFFPECAMYIERPSPARRQGFPITLLRDSHFLDYVRTCSAFEHAEGLGHWMFETYDGTLNVVCDTPPITEFVPVGFVLHKPEREVVVELPGFPAPHLAVSNPD